MYNEELKNRYLSSITSVAMRQRAVGAFNAIEKFESAWGSDICSRELPDIEFVFSKISSGTLRRSFNLRTDSLRLYGKWCIDNNIEGATDALLKANIKTDDIELLRRRTVRSPLHLQTVLDSVFEPEDLNTPDMIYRAFLWLGYSGISLDKAVYVTASDIDFPNRCIRIDGLEHPIYPESVRCLKSCCSSKTFGQRSASNPALIFQRKRADGSSILRSTTSQPSLNSLKTNLHHKVIGAQTEGRTNFDLSYTRVGLSGAFFRMYERELAGLPFEPLHDPAIQYMGEYAKDKKSAVKADYNRWKLTLA